MASNVADDSAKPETTKASKTSAKGQPPTGTSATAKNADGAKQPTKPTQSRKTPSETKKSRPSARRRKPTPSKTAASQTARTTTVQADLDKLEARMKRANSTTRKSVTSLETVVSALEATLKTTNASQKGRLTRHVNDLTAQLERQSEDMRSAVRRELKSALAEGSLSDLDAALGRASMRLDRAEVAQADSIARVNKHLADIARAVDARIKAESQSRKDALESRTAELKQAITETRSDVESRVAAVEKDSAVAFDKVGDTIEKIHGQMKDQRQADSAMVEEKVNELTVQTQAELNAYESKLEARLKEAEARNLAVGTGAAERVVERASEDIRHRIDALQARIEELEKKGPESAAALAAAPLPPLPTAKSPEPTPPQAPTQSPLPEGFGSVQALHDRVGTLRSSAQNGGSAAMVTSISANPYATEAKAPMSAPEAPAFLAPPSPVVPFPSSSQPVAPMASAPASTPSLPPFQMPSGQMPSGHTQSNLAPTVDDDFQPAPIPDPVYSNPAYAEGVNARAELIARSNGDSPTAVRVGGQEEKRRFSFSSVPALTNINPRVALLATAAVVVAVFAARIILGSSDGDLPNDIAQGPMTIENPETGQTQRVASTMPLTGVDGATLTPGTGPSGTAGALDGFPDTSTDPIGTYEEIQPVIIDTDKLQTLEAAVEAGNPVAQFQMGLAKLDAGETDDGAALIRQAASANQPAALYRLAKLYEAGEGVPRDDVMSRQLIERAARGGNRIAMHDLALYYTEGRGGVELDMGTAKSWFEQAARRGVVDSQFNLAILSESTETGTEPNLEDALFWYSIAARQGDQFAVSRRDALRATLNDPQVDAIDTRIAAFQPRPIDQAANGIFNDMPWVKNAETGPLDDQASIQQVQSLLTDLGYSVGTPDGIMGGRTRTAIQQFERSSGMSVTGEIDRELIGRLTRAAGV